MAHQIYQTAGIILRKKDFGEADRLFYIYTEKFGMVMATAKSVREEKSKLRPNLDLFVYGEFALIGSRDFWKVVDAASIMSPKPIIDIIVRLRVFNEIAGMALRMIKGEEANANLWLEIKNLFLDLFVKNVKKEEINNLEIGSMARILKILGYLGDVPNSKRDIVAAINRAIKESML